LVEAATAHRDLHLPESGFVAVFRFRGDCRLVDGTLAPPMVLTGLWDRLRTHIHSHDYGAVIALFTATGAAPLLPSPADEFTNKTIDLASVLGSNGALEELHAQLTAAITDEERLQPITAFLLTHLAQHRPDPQVAQAVMLLKQIDTPLRIGALAQQVGLSQSGLERRFRQQVGLPPRKYASLVRLQQVARLQKMGADFTTIAHAVGYADQAHFSKDFKNYIGLAPSTFFALPRMETVDETLSFA